MRRSGLFLGLVAVAAAQWIFIPRVDEPFPAITMPGFRGGGGHKGERLRRVDCAVAFGFADGRVREPSQRELLAPELPVGRHNEAMRTLCGLHKPRAVPAALLDRAPSYRRGRRWRETPEGPALLQEWATAAGRRIGGGAAPVWLELRRVELWVRHGGEGLTVERRVLDVERIPLP